MTAPGDEYAWVKPSKAGSAFLSGAPVRKCDNCERTDCRGPSVCSKELDQERITRNRNARMNRSGRGGRGRGRDGGGRGRGRGRGGRGGGAPRSKTQCDDKGRPLKYNKDSVLVVDTKKWRAMKLTETFKTKLDDIEKTAAALETQGSPDPKPSTSTPTDDDSSEKSQPTPSILTAKAHELRAILPKVFN